MARPSQHVPQTEASHESSAESVPRPGSRPQRAPSPAGPGNLAVQRKAQSQISIIEGGAPPEVAVERVGPNVSRVLVLGVAIATVKYFEKSGHKDPVVRLRLIPGTSGNPPRVQILLEAQPYTRVRWTRAGIDALAAHGYGVDVRAVVAGIEVTGDIESGYPILPPQDTDVISVEPPAAEAAPPPEVSEPTEVSPPEETRTPPPAPVPEEPRPSRLPEEEERALTSIERAAIRALLGEAADRQLRGEDAQALCEQAAAIAVGILERKTAAFDPESAKQKATEELLDATADVMAMAMGNGDAATEVAMNKATAWARTRLDRSVEIFKANPTWDNAVDMANKATTVMLFGGDSTEATELLLEHYPHPGSH